MISALIALLTSAPVGALIGGLLALLNRREDTKVELRKLDLEKDRMANAVELRKLDLEQTKAEAEGRKQVAIIEGEASIESERYRTLAKAFEADRVTPEELKEAGPWMRWLLVLVSTLQRLIRPLVTIAFMASVTWLNFELMALVRQMWPVLDDTKKFEMVAYVGAWYLTQAGAVLQYWFVSRGSGK